MRRRVLSSSSLASGASGRATATSATLAESRAASFTMLPLTSRSLVVAARTSTHISSEHKTLNKRISSIAFSTSSTSSPITTTCDRAASGSSSAHFRSIHTHRSLATMTVHNTNEACCTIPPVKSDYSPKGSTEKIGGLDAYTIGPKDAKHAIVVVYDIFGFHNATKQGADLLSESTKARVVMPDFFRGKPFPQEYYPPDTEEKKAAFQKFFGDAGDFGARKPDLEAVADELKKDGAAKLGLVGFCWGGKLSVLAGGEGTKFASVAQVHPAMVDAGDAEKLTVPIANFPSKDEPKKDVDAFEEVIQKKPFANDSVYKLYPESHHGWAAARADLSDEGNKKNFQDVYQRLADFFNKTLA